MYLFSLALCLAFSTSFLLVTGSIDVLSVIILRQCVMCHVDINVIYCSNVVMIRAQFSVAKFDKFRGEFGKFRGSPRIHS